tara:strand:- start:625 stop:2853 length:2229 start_codon:yes stop_codon:yes gene_type:complete
MLSGKPCMTDDIQSSLVFNPSTPILVFGILLIVAASFLCIWAWKRSGWARGVGFLEGLRFLIVLLVVLTLFQPEWRELTRPDSKPTIAVLWDQSRSMETADVIDPEGNGQKPKKRSSAIAPLLEEKAWWPLGNGVRTVIEPFSSTMDPAWEGTDLHGALNRVLAQHPQLRGVVLFTDGDWNAGEPPVRAATKLRMRNVPVFAVPVGSESRLPDVELVSLDAPTFGVVGKPLRIPFVIESSMPRDFNADLELTTSTGETVSKTITIPAMGKVQDTISWTPEQTGDVELTLIVPPGPNEFLEENNRRVAPISIREEQLRVLLIESYPRWEYRYLRNALERDPGVEVSCLLFHPDIGKTGGGRSYIDSFPSDEDLVNYDVVFLGDVGVEASQLSEEQCKRLVQLVRNQASGLVFLPGFRGRQFSLLDTELSDLYPVVLDETQPRGWGSPVPGQFQLTEVGNRSLLTKLEDSDSENYKVWENLPGFQWFAPALRAKAGSEVLATHSSESTEFGRIPLIVTKTFGAGKILFMGTDGAWRWREGVEDKYHYRYWGQVARWMAYQRNMAQGELMRLFYSPDRPRTNEVLTLNANVISLGGDPLQEANVVVQFISPSGKTGSVRLSPGGEDAWGLFSGRFTPVEPGEYQVIMTCRENGATLETSLSVQGGKLEKLGRPARISVLEEIAQVTRGKLMKTLDMAVLLETVQSLPDPEPIERRFRLWSHWLWGMLLVSMMGAFWIGRKMVGVI